MLRASERKKLREENIQRLTEEYTTYFTTHHNITFVRRLGIGTGAVALLFRESKDEVSGTKERNIAVKFAFSEYEHRNAQADDELENERRFLTLLQGAEHVVKVLGYEVDRASVSRPVLVLEYVGYGSIQDLCKRITARGVRVPNRVLWCMFLCLIRACIGFAYPPWQNDEQERIPTDGSKSHSSIIHNDLHDENVLIGELMPDGIEHREVPFLKAIDFGKAAVVPPGNWESADQKNIQEAARIITGVVAKKYSTLRDENMEAGIPDEAGTVRKIIVYTDPALRHSSYILPGLKNLLFLCQAANPNERPGLQHVLNACENAVMTHTAETYADIEDYDNTLESDEAIQSLIQQIVFDPDI
ncbi:kinase-like domain-containing protein [Xylaria venustula]|nr:kinase-like domain-containing protein [Xylaria venustula]